MIGICLHKIMRQEPGDEATIKDSTVASLGIGFLQQSTPELIIGLRCHVNQLSIPVTPHNIMYIHFETVLISARSVSNSGTWYFEQH